MIEGTKTVRFLFVKIMKQIVYIISVYNSADLPDTSAEDVQWVNQERKPLDRMSSINT